MSESAWGLPETGRTQATRPGADRRQPAPAPAAPAAPPAPPASAASGAAGGTGTQPAPLRPAGAASGAAGASAAVPPKVSAAAHNGIVWLHLAAIVLWVGVAAILGLVGATGRDIPAVVFVACLAAGAGHALFLGLHSLLGSVARRRQGTEPTLR